MPPHPTDYFNDEGIMAEGDSPTIARRRVRIAVREAREAAGLTQAHVAEEMEWSLSKVIRIENGDVSISIADLRSLLNLLAVRDKERVSALVADARIARQRGRQKTSWWEAPQFRQHMPDPLRKFVEYEAEASEIRSFAPFYVPGLLQTPEYGAALTGTWVEEVGEAAYPQAKVDVIVDTRRHRQESLLQRLDSVRAFFLVDQSVLLRPFGGSAVFAAQLRRLIKLSQNENIMLRMLPFDLGIAIANNGAFDLMTVGADSAEGEVMYRENGMTDDIVESRVETARHRRRFDQLWRAAAEESDTIAYLQERITALEANLPNGRR